MIQVVSFQLNNVTGQVNFSKTDSVTGDFVSSHSNEFDDFMVDYGNEIFGFVAESFFALYSDVGMVDITDFEFYNPVGGES